MDYLEEEMKILEEIIVIRDRENKDIVHEMNLIRKACPQDLLKAYDD